MAVQQELDCVSCETTFDPGPNGGFCPDCDTPHPDYEMRETDGEDEIQSVNDEKPTEPDEDASDGDEQLQNEAATFYDESASESESEPEAETDDSEPIEEPTDLQCSSCGMSVDASASFCSNCGSEIDGDEADAEDEDETSDEESPSELTLLVDGESYSFGDGDTFGRQDEAWLDDLVTASGGREDASFISGEHLEFEIGEDGVYVTDRSTNGTSHNGESLDGARVKLDDGDTLELAGRATIDVEL